MWVAIALMMAATLSACNKSDEETKPEEPVSKPEGPVSNKDNERKFIWLTRAEYDLVNENNNFAFNLFRQVKKRARSKFVARYDASYLLYGTHDEVVLVLNDTVRFHVLYADRGDVGGATVFSLSVS